MTKFFIIFFLLFINTSYSQITNTRYSIGKPAVKIISSLDLKNNTEIESKLSSGESLILRYRYLKLEMILKYGQEETFLKIIDYNTESISKEDMPILELYEYDFNNDGNKEILVVTSLDEIITTLEVYKHKEALIKKVGNFDMGISATFNNNIISLYTGIRDYHFNYIFYENEFWKLNWHNPNKSNN